LKQAAVVSLARKAAISAGVLFAARKLFSATGRRRKISLAKKTVLITGGSRGLGLALAQEFGSRGARIALCARDASELEQAAAKLRNGGIEAQPFVCDVTNSSAIEPLLDRVSEHFGGIDVLVNNAGSINVGPFNSFDHSEFERAMNLMFWAPVNLTLAMLPRFQKRGGGHIVNITSVGGRVSVPHLLPYSCAKFALVGFSTGLSAEAFSKGVHVLTAVPGLMRTGSYLNAEFTGKSKQEFAWFGLLGNLPGFSVAAEYAASSIRKALENGQQDLIISLPAKLLIALDALLPDLNRRLFAAVNQTLLPSAGDSDVAFGGESTQRGKPLNTNFGKLFQALTALGKQAALRLNE